MFVQKVSAAGLPYAACMFNLVTAVETVYFRAELKKGTGAEAGRAVRNPHRGHVFRFRPDAGH